jgi:hypothetical protein
MTAAQSSSFIIQDLYKRPSSGRRTKWTQSHPQPKKFKTLKEYFLHISYTLLYQLVTELESQLQNPEKHKILLKSILIVVWNLIICREDIL